MAVLNRIAHFQGRRDEVPNQELARELAAKKDRKGIREIAENLWNVNKDVQSDCLKVLYEVGESEPALIAGYAGDFLKLLKSKNNRLVWGGMTALATIAALRADEIFEHEADVRHAMETGSVIARDQGVKILAAVAAQEDRFNKRLFPHLLEHLATSRPKDVPQHAESIAPAVNAANKARFVAVLEERQSDLSAAQSARIKKLVKQLDKRFPA